MLLEKKEQILKLVKEYISEKNEQKTWTEGEDWVTYSGPHLDEKEFVDAVDVLIDGWMIFGKNNREFERRFPEHLGRRFGVLTNSGSSANLLAMSCLKSKSTFNLKPGAKFITPVVCFPTTINPIIQNGFKPVFVDVTLPNLNLNLDHVEKKLQEDPEIKGIVFAHVLGNPPDMDRLMGLVEKYNLIFIEDACDALGSTYDGKKLGSYGHISTCSFFPAHHMTTGEGGFVATNDYKIRKSLSSFRDWGRACYCNDTKPGNVTAGTACGNRFKSWLPKLPEAIYDHRYVFNEIGYNIKPLDLQGAIGLQQLKKLPEMDAARRNNFDRLIKIFSKYEKYFWLPKATEKADPCWFGFLLTVKDAAPFSKQRFVQHMEDNKIQTRSYFTGNALAHPAYEDFANEYEDIRKAFPVATYVTSNTLFLGTFIGISDEKMNYIEKVVDSFFAEAE
jgi:CDP-6-deoxy-D-xylo-4-hexulose-3-dehydrase